MAHRESQAHRQQACSSACVCERIPCRSRNVIGAPPPYTTNRDATARVEQRGDLVALLIHPDAAALEHVPKRASWAIPTQICMPSRCIGWWTVLTLAPCPSSCRSALRSLSPTSGSLFGRLNPSERRAIVRPRTPQSGPTECRAARCCVNALTFQLERPLGAGQRSPAPIAESTPTMLDATVLASLGATTGAINSMP